VVEPGILLTPLEICNSKVSYFKPIFVCLSVVKPAETGCWQRTPRTKHVRSLLRTYWGGDIEKSRRIGEKSERVTSNKWTWCLGRIQNCTTNRMYFVPENNPILSEVSPIVSRRVPSEIDYRLEPIATLGNESNVVGFFMHHQPTWSAFCERFE